MARIALCLLVFVGGCKATFSIGGQSSCAGPQYDPHYAANVELKFERNF